MMQMAKMLLSRPSVIAIDIVSADTADVWDDGIPPVVMKRYGRNPCPVRMLMRGLRSCADTSPARAAHSAVFSINAAML